MLTQHAPLLHRKFLHKQNFKHRVINDFFKFSDLLLNPSVQTDLQTLAILIAVPMVLKTNIAAQDHGLIQHALHQQPRQDTCRQQQLLVMFHHRKFIHIIIE
jgi:hypothetical protein